MHSNNNISIDAKLSEKDILLCKYRMLFNNTEYGFMTGISIFGLIYFISLFTGQDISSIDFAYEIKSHFPGSVISIFFPILVVVLLTRTYLDNKKEFKGREYLQINYFFSDFGISSTVETEKSYMWKDIRAIQETKKYFYIHISESSMLVVPKREFATNDDIKKLRSLFSDKMLPKKLSLKKR